MEFPDDGLVPFEKLDYDTEAIKAAAGELQAVAGRLQRYDAALHDEIMPLLGSGMSEERADAAGRASCLSQEVIEEIQRLRDIGSSVHRASSPDCEVAQALSELLAAQEPQLHALATKAQQVSTQLLGR